jgi:hypothetical protein
MTMAYLSTAVRCTCSKWRKLSDEQRADRRWVMVHHMHHNVKAGRAPFTANRIVELAECSEKEALDVLTEAVQLKWFRHIPAAAGQPGYYLSPVKPK